MNGSFQQQRSSSQKARRSSFAGITILVGLINWLASLIRLTEEELQDAGVYLDRPGGE